MPLSAGQVINNRYRIRSTLGQSRQEVVYSAWDISLNSPVAIQEILNTSPDCIQEFGYEARRLANLRHPGLPYVVDHFNLPGQGQYLILEYVDGKDLQSLVNQSGKGLPWAQVVSWFGQVGEALAYLHSQTPPIIHREVKPANIKIIPSGQAMLVGNGIARSADPGRRATFVPGSGSVAFLSPEFFANQADVRSDIYSLGATLYATLTGRMPLESLKRQAGQPLMPPRQINPAIPPGIEQAVLKAMQLAPEGRFQSVREMLAALGIAVRRRLSGGADGTGRSTRGKCLASSAKARSSGWMLGVIIGVLVLCLIGGILGGLGIYTYVYTPSQTAAKQTDTELVKTATALLPVSDRFADSVRLHHRKIRRKRDSQPDAESRRWRPARPSHPARLYRRAPRFFLRLPRIPALLLSCLPILPGCHARVLTLPGFKLVSRLL